MNQSIIIMCDPNITNTIDIQEGIFCPVQFSQILYNSPPKEYNTVLLQHNDEIYQDPTLLFELLLLIYLEGITNGVKLYNILFKTNNELRDICSEDITITNLQICDKWFRSMGYIIHITEYEEDDYSFSDNDYCEIFFKFNNIDFFEYYNIKTNYNFILYKSFNCNTFSNMNAIIANNKKIYTIKFNKL